MLDEEAAFVSVSGEGMRSGSVEQWSHIFSESVWWFGPVVRKEIPIEDNNVTITALYLVFAQKKNRSQWRRRCKVWLINPWLNVNRVNFRKPGVFIFCHIVPSYMYTPSPATMEHMDSGHHHHGQNDDHWSPSSSWGTPRPHILHEQHICVVLPLAYIFSVSVFTD